jgi:translation initiation factor 2 alpha subunit (eIF-2alpha)
MMKEGKSKEKKTAEQVKRDPYTLVAYVSGPVYRFDVSAKDFDEAYKLTNEMLMRALEAYGGRVQIERIELERFSDKYF